MSAAEPDRNVDVVAGGHPARPGPDRQLETAVAGMLSRADDLARGDLEGIEDAAHQLIELAGGDVRVVSEARRLAAARLESDASTQNNQVMALIRRALEVGMGQWSMEETRPLS